MEESNWFLDIQELPDVPHDIPKQSLEITEVAPGSPAETLNLAKGDWFVSINDIAAASADIPEVLVSEKIVDYVFILESGSKMIKVSTPALPVGVRTEFASEDIVKNYESKPLHDFEGLKTLWQRRDYKHIRSICSAAKSSGFANRSGLSKKVTKQLHDILVAICKVEEGKTDITDVYEKFQTFVKENWYGLTTDLTGVLDYYIALGCRAEDDLNGYRNAMSRAMESPGNKECPRLKAEAKKGNISYVKESPPTGGRFGPIKGAEVLVGDKLPRWKDSLVVPYCLMLTYRGNGPYEDALKVYRSIYPFMKPKMGPMIVLTTERDRPRDNPEYFLSEDAMAAEDLPISVLYSQSVAWTDAVIAGAPEFLVVSKKGAKILWRDGLYDDFCYWKMLSVVENELA